MSIKWYDCLDRPYSSAYCDDIILKVRISSKRRKTYRVYSKYTGYGFYSSTIVYERAKVFDSIDNAKEWLIQETLKRLAKAYQELQELSNE